MLKSEMFPTCKTVPYTPSCKEKSLLLAGHVIPKLNTELASIKGPPLTLAGLKLLLKYMFLKT